MLGDEEDLIDPTIQLPPSTVSEGQMAQLNDMFTPADMFMPPIPPPSPAPPRSVAGDDDASSRHSDNTAQRQEKIEMYGILFTAQCDVMLKAMVDFHNSAISRVRQAIEQANCTEYCESSQA